MKQSAMSPRTGRIIELDIAKGLGILSVILYNTLPASPLHTALGGYMMPLFFVVSGLVMQRDACSFSLRRFWEKNARLPFYYILFSAIYLLCSAVTCIAGNGSCKALALDGIAALVGCGFNVLWFLSTLFFGKLLCSLLTGSPLSRWAQGLFLAGLFLLAAGIGRAVDFTALSGVGRVLGMVGLTVLRPMEAAFYLFIGSLLQGAFCSLRKRCTKPAMVAACGIGGTVLTVGCGLLAQAAPQDMYDLTASRPLLSLAAAALGCAGILGISLALAKVPMLNKGLAFLGVHSLYLMAIHNQPNLYGWLNKLSVKLCAGLPGWYMQGMFFLLLTVAALIIAMGLEPRLDPVVCALSRRCTGQRKDQTNPERS